MLDEMERITHIVLYFLPKNCKTGSEIPVTANPELMWIQGTYNGNA